MISIEQLTLIRTYLRQRGLRQGELLEEWVDHLATEIEADLQQGQSFQTAWANCQAQYKGVNLKRINRKVFIIHHQTTFIMTSIFTILLTVSLLLPWKPSTPVGVPTPTLMPQVERTLEPPDLWPIEGTPKITSGFGMRTHPITQELTRHHGVDIRAETGTPVIAPAAGKVVEAQFHKMKGNYVVLQHDETYTTRYYHLDGFTVEAGQEIPKGMVIGHVGNSGVSKAPHLHYEVRKEGKAVDPMDYMTSNEE